MRRMWLGCMILGALAGDLVVSAFRRIDTSQNPLPADLQAIKITTTGMLTPNYALVHLFAEKGYKGYALVDSAGRIAWHYRTRTTRSRPTAGPTATSCSWTRATAWSKWIAAARSSTS